MGPDGVFGTYRLSRRFFAADGVLGAFLDGLAKSQSVSSGTRVRAGQELRGVLLAGVHEVPPVLPVPAVVRSHYGFRALCRLALGVVQEAMTDASVAVPGARVVVTPRLPPRRCLGVLSPSWPHVK